MAVDTALAEAEYHPANLDDERAWSRLRRS
jgi:hypothetical protein